MAKGSEFERGVCKQLSLWWTGGNSDDVFWRTANSGGRATSRRKRGLKARHHNGDIDAVDPCGKPLTELLAIELKRGYSRETFADLLDRNGSTRAAWEDWIVKADSTRKACGAAFWFLVVRRDRRKALCAFPVRMSEELRDLGAWAGKRDTPVAALGVQVAKQLVRLTVMRLEDFLACVTPGHIRELVKTC